MEQADGMLSEESTIYPIQDPKNQELGKRLNIGLRGEILHDALFIEKSLSTLLVKLFEVSVPNSRTLGNKSSSLTFRNKVDLLFDLKLIDKDEAANFQLFMEVRNQFMHNYDCSNFSKCSEYVDAFKLSTLRKKYPDVEEKGGEIEYQHHFVRLVAYLLNILQRLFDEATERIRAKVYNSVSLELLEAMQSAQDNVFDSLTKGELVSVALSALPEASSASDKNQALKVAQAVFGHILTSQKKFLQEFAQKRRTEPERE